MYQKSDNKSCLPAVLVLVEWPYEVTCIICMQECNNMQQGFLGVF
jgi:hypothetical protein